MFQLDVDKPEDKPLQEWLGMHDVRQFLSQTRHGNVPIYYLETGRKGTGLISSILLPRRLAGEQQIEELLAWNFSPVDSQWGYSTGSRGNRLIAPFAWERPTIFQRAIPILTARQNSCLKDRPVYFEVNPQLTHIHDLHWLEEHSAYCTLDDNGDIQEIIKFRVNNYQGQITIAEDILLKHLLLGDFVLVRLFDFDRRLDAVAMPTEADFERRNYWQGEGIYARWTPVHDNEPEPSRSYLRGLQIIRPPANRKERKLILEGKKLKQYCTYIAQDWKHDQIAEVSCDPKKLGNYFVESSYPFETSPVFFRREVLLKYQSDPEKYTVEDQHIHCRSSWDLRYDVNEANQVHTLLIDLGRLPYAEQLHWKVYNETPKAGISERTYRTSFLGEWYDEPEPLRDLKQLMLNFPQANTPSGLTAIWKQPSGPDADLADRVHYLATNSPKEWETEIVALDKFIVEGIYLKHLRKVAEQLGIEHQTLGSITLLGAVLLASGIAQDIVDSIVGPLKELQGIRSKVASHRKSEDTAALLKQIRREHKSLADHYKYLIRSLFQGMSVLADLIKRDILNVL